MVLYDAPGPVESSSRPITISSGDISPADPHPATPKAPTAAATAAATTLPILTTDSRLTPTFKRLVNQAIA
ncbi:hypothetical protein RE9416_38870 [Prescottella equi]|nr:hypothetical protein RE9416_38870 [Prescottella equi]BDC74091.1 hypothetical protein KAREA_40060 [Prescottella equi]